MKKLIAILLAIVLAFAATSAAAQGAQDAAAAPPADVATMQKMHENMQSMQDLMARIHATPDPAARRKLVREHRELMHAQMGLIKSMGPVGDSCGPMMGMGQERMGMMQMMMDQMMQRDEVSDGKAGKPAQ